MNPKFKIGDRVHIANAWPPGHVRTPWYVRGKTGTIVAYQGAFKNPEKLALGKPGLPEVPLYSVRFSHGDLWGDSPSSDTLECEVFEHWLEPAEPVSASAQS